MKTTTMKISMETKQKLDAIKDDDDTYDDVVNRLLLGYGRLSSRKKRKIEKKEEANKTLS